ncbi:hypothetical protein [Lacrimispora xylanisolvens]|uniref:hypothetical protein n=1 Tax=Lacrimispora xylanisolvens TaxID=384636 RepID=UPI0024026B84
MAAVEYGIIGIRPMGEWDPDTKYDLLNLVTQNGSSYVAHTDPPLGSLPTNAAYWQTSAQGTSKATADSVGTVKPDGTTTEVSTEGSLSVKTASQNTLGLVKGSNGIKVGTDGSVDINTLFEQATELANIIAGEAIASALGKISKSIAVTMNLDQNALLKNMLTNMDANDQNKIPTSAFVHTLWARIGMGTELTAGANLTAVVEALNSNLGAKANATDLAKIHNLTDVSFVTDFNGGGLATTPGRWKVYNASGTAANAPYSGAVSGYVEVVINGNIATNGTLIFQTLHDYNGDVYTKVVITGSGYGTWKKLTP